jgi:replicative DNA helicase
MNIEKIILHQLIKNEEYGRRVLPYLEKDYFEDDGERIIFEKTKEFLNKFDTLPTIESLAIAVSNVSDGISDSDMKNALETIKSFETEIEQPNLDWLINETETFCQDKALYLGMRESIEIMNNKKGNISKGSIPEILRKALSISFDPNVGHDYLEQYLERWETYHRKEEKIPFDLEYFNKITRNGLSRKTLNIILAGTGVGKSLFMCHMAAAALHMQRNVLYITLELSEEKVSERIDANLMNINISDIETMPKNIYVKKIEQIKSKTTGRLIIKEYPTAMASATHFKALLVELQQKKEFVPDIVFVDYLNICASSRLKKAANDSYEYVKSIAEELRGLAVEYNLPIVSATQTNRTGFSSSDFGLEHTSESFGLPMTADFMVGLVSNEDLAKLNQMMVIQLKSRYGDININRKFMIGVDKAKMRLYDVSPTAQDGIIQDQVSQEPPKVDANIKDKIKRLRGT